MQRRKFIRNTAVTAVGVPGLVNGFSLSAHAEDSMIGRLLQSGTANDHILVLVQLSGGNDGLNTVIPLDQYSNYYNARTNIAIAENRVLPLTGTNATGLHPSFSGFRDLYNNGDLCIIQSVGYPSPVFSHFRATDIWNTASDSNQYLNDGWLGRYLNAEYNGFPAAFPTAEMPDPLAIQFGSSAALALLGPTSPMAYSISDPNAFINNANGGQDAVASTTPMGDKLKHVRDVSRQSEIYSTVIRTAYNMAGNNNLATYPNNTFASQFKIIAKLINGGLKTKVYVVTLKGFDTHVGQAVGSDTSTGVHATQLSIVSEAVKAFYNDIKLMNKDQRVMGMVFSEFGRRIKSNAGTGTDHGYAAPVFLFGSPVTGGIIGTNPLLPSVAGVDDNIDMQYDFRQVYYSIMKRWLCQDSTSLQQIIQPGFTDLNICNNADCAPLGRPTAVNENNFVNTAPNPSSGISSLSFYTAGGHTLLQLVSKEGRPLQTLLETTYDRPQTINKQINISSFPTGMYYIRYQNGRNVQMKPILKVQ
ncbi:MAG: DUF1501 domain-containing protein [Bacteroidota bacterium]